MSQPHPQRDQVGSVSLDVLVVGGGIAGLTVVASLPASMSVGLVSKGGLAQAATPYAQGGIAAAWDSGDSPEAHGADTIAAGAGLSEPGAVATLVGEGEGAIEFLERHGASFDRADGRRQGTLEGGHHYPRVLHAGGDATGAELWRAMSQAAGARLSHTWADAFLVELLRADDGSVSGALLYDQGSLVKVFASAVVLATGGAGRLYSQTTNPPSSTGDGIAAALAAGAEIVDLEFIQFHPTALYQSADRRPLVTEALRGEGARLRTREGELIMDGVHPLGDLAPRDIVARAIFSEMADSGSDHVYLDATSLGSELLRHRFPTVSQACAGAGIDPANEWIPVSPAAHYTMGGVRTDLVGRATLAGLYAVGEIAWTGVHGANRLASNSLLEGVVFGRRAADDIAGTLAARRPVSTLEPTRLARNVRPGGPSVEWLRVQMMRNAGLVRHAEGLERLAAGLAWRQPLGGNPRGWEADNLFTLARVVSTAALRRQESRGAHWRNDYPTPDERWRVHQVALVDPDGEIQISDLEFAGDNLAAMVAS